MIKKVKFQKVWVYSAIQSFIINSIKDIDSQISCDLFKFFYTILPFEENFISLIHQSQHTDCYLKTIIIIS